MIVKHKKPYSNDYVMHHKYTWKNAGDYITGLRDYLHKHKNHSLLVKEYGICNGDNFPFWVVEKEGNAGDIYIKNHMHCSQVFNKFLESGPWILYENGNGKDLRNRKFEDVIAQFRVIGSDFIQKNIDFLPNFKKDDFMLDEKYPSALITLHLIGRLYEMWESKKSGWERPYSNGIIDVYETLEKLRLPFVMIPEGLTETKDNWSIALKSSW